MDELLPMRLFVKVAELRSFARAATELNISNSSATRLVMSIEDRLGARLLNRTTRSLSLTDAGHLYLAQIRHVIDEIDRVEETIASMHHEPIGSLKIAAPVMFGMHVLAPAIDAFKARRPIRTISHRTRAWHSMPISRANTCRSNTNKRASPCARTNPHRRTTSG